MGMKRAHRILAGIGLFLSMVYLLLYSNLLQLLEGTNLDGSTSITWRSFVAMVVLLTVSEFFVFWAFRRRIALTVLGGFGASVLFWMWLTQSRFAFTWEPRDPFGIGPITWRSDLVLLAVLCSTQGAAFLVRLFVRRGVASRRPLSE